MATANSINSEPAEAVLGIGWYGWTRIDQTRRTSILRGGSKGGQAGGEGHGPPV